MAEAGPRTTDCAIVLDGERLPARAGEPIAVAMLAAGVKVLSRSIKFHRPRSFFCLAGHCGACLMRVDGQPNVKACRAPAHDGCTIERQNAFPSGKLDLLAAADLFFPRGMDHHTMFTHPRAVNSLMQKVVRQLGGLGRLPERPPAEGEIPASRRETVEVAVVGGGPAGLAAAIECARAGRRVTLFDEGAEPGGSLLSHPAHGPSAAAALAVEARARGVTIRSGASALAWYPEDEGGLLAVDDRGALVRVQAARYLYATGAYDVNALFRDNDRPGIFAARAVGQLLVRHGLRPGKRPVVLGAGPYARALADALEAAGAEVQRIDGVRDRVTAAHGRAWVTGLDVEGEGGKRRVKCDLVAVAALPAPASELPRQHGAEVALDPPRGGFSCLVDEGGRTTAANVYAAGDACGFRGVDEARAHGAQVGRAAAESLRQ